MKKLFALFAVTFLVGCSSFYPPKHDTALFYDMVKVDIAIEHVPCVEDQVTKDFYNARIEWGKIKRELEVLLRYAEWRSDPQLPNIEGMYNNASKLSEPDAIKSKTFCELSKKVARERINSLRKAWEGR